MQTWSSQPRTRIHPSLLPTVIRKPGHNIISCFEVLHGHISYREQKDVGETERGEGLKYFNYAVVELVHYWGGMQSSGRRAASPPSTLIQLPALSEYVITLAACRRRGPNFKIYVRIRHYSVFQRQDNWPWGYLIISSFYFINLETLISFIFCSANIRLTNLCVVCSCPACISNFYFLPFATSWNHSHSQNVYFKFNERIILTLTIKPKRRTDFSDLF